MRQHVKGLTKWPEPLNDAQWWFQQAELQPELWCAVVKSALDGAAFHNVSVLLTQSWTSKINLCLAQGRRDQFEEHKVTDPNHDNLYVEMYQCWVPGCDYKKTGKPYVNKTEAGISDHVKRYHKIPVWASMWAPGSLCQACGTEYAYRANLLQHLSYTNKNPLSGTTRCLDVLVHMMPMLTAEEQEYYEFLDQQDREYVRSTGGPTNGR